MTTISAPPAGGAPRLGALLRSEAQRAASRRSLVWLTALAVLGVIGVAAILWFTSAHVTQADVEVAADRFRADQQQYYAQCLADPSIPQEERASVCWKPTEQEVLDNAQWNLAKQPFGQDGLVGLLTFAGGIGLLASVLLAASTGGADWGARTMGLLLSWEPRRLRVFLVRMSLVIVMGLAIEALLVCVALGLGALIADAHVLDPSAEASLGSYYEPPDLGAGWELALRWLPLAALGAAGSFAVAMASRSTGWAIGASIGFVAVVETVVQGVWAWGSQWLVQTNVAAWLQGGIAWQVDRHAPQSGGATVAGPTGAGITGDGMTEGALPGYVTISDTRALATLGILVLLASALSWLLFAGRDVD